MSNSERVKPQFGRKMDPCEYKSKWANRLPASEVIAIRAEDTRIRKEESRENR